MTEAELLAELHRASRHSDEGASAQEIADEMGLDVKNVLRMLARAQATGRLIVGFRAGLRVDGRGKRTPVYRIKARGKAA